MPKDSRFYVDYDKKWQLHARLPTDDEIAKNGGRDNFFYVNAYQLYQDGRLRLTRTRVTLGSSGISDIALDKPTIWQQQYDSWLGVHVPTQAPITRHNRVARMGDDKKVSVLLSETPTEGLALVQSMSDEELLNVYADLVLQISPNIQEIGDPNEVQHGKKPQPTRAERHLGGEKPTRRPQGINQILKTYGDDNPTPRGNRGR